MALFSRKNLKPQNPYGLTKDDLKGDIKDLPMGIVVRMLEEQELQGNKPDVTIFQKYSESSAHGGIVLLQRSLGGFNYEDTEAGTHFWRRVLAFKNYWMFFEKYPDYDRYN